MTITNGYATLAQVKQGLEINDSDSGDDTQIELIVEGVSRKFDDRCNRIFYFGSLSTRYFTALDTENLFVDDIASLASDSDVVISLDTKGDQSFDTSLSSSDFFLSPYNAEQLGVPYQKIEISPSSTRFFSKNQRKGIKIVARWGWPVAVPKPINQACILQSERLFKRFATPLGSESMTALGRMTLTIPNLDPDVEAMISRYIKPVWG